jgi:hypothetical protein
MIKKTILTLIILTTIITLNYIPTANFLQTTNNTEMITITQNTIQTPHLIKFYEEPLQELTIIEVSK